MSLFLNTFPWWKAVLVFLAGAVIHAAPAGTQSAVACNDVYEYFPDDKDGCYDICQDPDKFKIITSDKDLEVACAITTGVEW